MTAAGLIEEYHRVAALPDARLRAAKLEELVFTAELAYARRRGGGYFPVYKSNDRRGVVVFRPESVVRVPSPAGGCLSLWQLDHREFADYDPATPPSPLVLVHATLSGMGTLDPQFADSTAAVFSNARLLTLPDVLAAHHHGLPDLFVAVEVFLSARELS